MTELQKLFQESKAREEKATPGPWETQTDAIVSMNPDPSYKFDLVFDASSESPYSPSEEDLDFITAARTEVGAWREIAVKAIRELELQIKARLDVEDGYERVTAIDVRAELMSILEPLESLAKQTRATLGATSEASREKIG